jgi:hypothetical protein
MFMYMSLFNMLMSTKTLRVFDDVANQGIFYNGGSTIAMWDHMGRLGVFPIYIKGNLAPYICDGRLGRPAHMGGLASLN